jgi:hypothetical protein
LSAEQVEDALAEQRSTGDPLGEILVARGHISRIDLAAALSTQWTWPKTESVDEAPQEVPSQVVETHDHHPTAVAAVAAQTEPVVAQAPATATAVLLPVELAAQPPFPVAASVHEPPEVAPPPPDPRPSPPPVPQAPPDHLVALEARLAALEDGGRLLAELQARLRSAYEQLAAAEARLGALEPGVSALAQAYSALSAQLQAQSHELAALRAASVKHEAQISTAARALLA